MQHYKCYIIRLKENDHSCQMAADCHQAATNFGIVPEFFDAINGNDSEYHYNKLNIKQMGKFKKNRPGVAGCFLSHFYIWKECVSKNIPYIVLEHDGYFIKQLPNNVFDLFNDVLKLDKLDPYDSDYNLNIENEKDLDIKVEPYTNPRPKEKTRLGMNTNYFKGAYSYIIKPAAAKKLINQIELNGHVPADQQLNSTIVDLKTTSVTVARLHPFYSISDNIRTASLTRNPI